uniref:Ig-like domain-containing protein n=1 Tax=Esox lucius TaxID=8010 RepID=A0AAY5JVD7_ESOLU
MMQFWTIFWLNTILGCALTTDVIQPDSVIVTRVGRSVSLTCFCPSNMMNSVLWFKQTVGQKPLLMASSSHYSQETFYFNNFTKDFSGTKRLSVMRGENSFNLTISKTEPGDSATFYCGALYINRITFASGTVLIVKGSESKSKSVLQQPVSESVQPGDSVTLNCTINTGTCEGEHSVYWFRHDSGESPPGIIYTNGDRSGQCMKSPESWSPTQSCVYNLPKRNLSLSDTGTYYCAVASCGEILFGNGTKLDIQDPLGNQVNSLLFIVISFLTTAVILSVIINIIFCMRMKRSQCEHCAETTTQHGDHGNANASMSNRQLHDDTTMNYVSLKFTDKKSAQSRRPRREKTEMRNQREEETMYSALSHRDRV